MHYQAQLVFFFFWGQSLEFRSTQYKGGDFIPLDVRTVLQTDLAAMASRILPPDALAIRAAPITASVPPSRDIPPHAADDLPPFLFLKKPIKCLFNRSVISENLPATQPHRDDTESPVSFKRAPTTSYNHIDYNEQIRAPRMTNATTYTYGRGDHSGASSFVNSRKETGSSVRANDSKESVLSQDSPVEEGVKSYKDPISTAPSTAANSGDGSSNQYLPAAFDLSKPMRRFSAPYTAEDDDSAATILSYTTNNYIYERNNNVTRSGLPQDSSLSTLGNQRPQLIFHQKRSISNDSDSDSLVQKEKLMKALKNLNNNMTTDEEPAQSSPRVKNRPSAYNCGRLADVHGSNLQQVYELKKPLIVPAVLRRNDHPQLGRTNSSSPSPEERSPDSPIPAFTTSTPPPHRRQSISELNSPVTPYSATLELSKIESSSPREAVEPTHQHWKPNSFTDHCMKCFDLFGTFFLNPQRKRRHHCRFCGFIYCVSCLYKNPEAYVAGNTKGIDEELSLKNIISGGSLHGILSYGASGNNVSTIASSNEDYISGVMMDSGARLVVPNYTNLLKANGNFGEEMKSLKKLFKYCKICKNCGSNYQNLIHALKEPIPGQTADQEYGNAPYIFIENPYLKKAVEGEQGKVPSGGTCADSGRPQRKSDVTVAATLTEERKPSLSNVPSDWTWSSF